MDHDVNDGRRIAMGDGKGFVCLGYLIGYAMFLLFCTGLAGLILRGNGEKRSFPQEVKSRNPTWGKFLHLSENLGTYLFSGFCRREGPWGEGAGKKFLLEKSGVYPIEENFVCL